MINKVMSINMNVKAAVEPNFKSKYFLSNNSKNTIQQILTSKDPFVKTGFSAQAKAFGANPNSTNGLRSMSQKPKMDDKYKMPNITSHMFNVSPPMKSNNPTSNKSVSNMIGQNNVISPLKQSAKFMMTNEKKNVASVNNRNAFLQQLKKDDTSPKQRFKETFTSNKDNVTTSSPGGNPINTMQSAVSLNPNNTHSSLNGLNVNLKDAIRNTKNDPKVVTETLKAKDSSDKKRKDSTPPKKGNKRGTLVETDKLRDIFEEKFKFVEQGGDGSESSQFSDSDSEADSPKTKSKATDGQIVSNKKFIMISFVFYFTI